MDDPKLLLTILASECIGWTWGEAQGLLRLGPCMPMMLEFTDICLSMGIKTAEDPGMVGLGRVPGMEAGMGCLCLL